MLSQQPHSNALSDPRIQSRSLQLVVQQSQRSHTISLTLSITHSLICRFRWSGSCLHFLSTSALICASFPRSPGSRSNQRSHTKLWLDSFRCRTFSPPLSFCLSLLSLFNCTLLVNSSVNTMCKNLWQSSLRQWILPLPMATSSEPICT